MIHMTREAIEKGIAEGTICHVRECKPFVVASILVRNSEFDIWNSALIYVWEKHLLIEENV